MTVKLPKQWRYWCRKAGLRPAYGGRSKYDWFSLRGKSRVWRVTFEGVFESAEMHNFDRWGNCQLRVSVSLPTSEKEFNTCVNVETRRLT